MPQDSTTKGISECANIVTQRRVFFVALILFSHEGSYVLILLQVEGIYLAIKRADIDNSINNRWRRVDCVPRSIGPEHCAADGIECIQLVVLRTKVNDAIRDGRRRVDPVSCS